MPEGAGSNLKVFFPPCIICHRESLGDIYMSTCSPFIIQWVVASTYLLSELPHSYVSNTRTSFNLKGDDEISMYSLGPLLHGKAEILYSVIPLSPCIKVSNIKSCRRYIYSLTLTLKVTLLFFSSELHVFPPSTPGNKRPSDRHATSSNPRYSPC